MKLNVRVGKFVVCLVALLATASGCGSSGPATINVTGKILQSGEPVDGAIVVFTPVDSDGAKVAAQGETDAKGEFSLSTYLGGEDYKPGIASGQYDVSVTKLEVVQDMRRQPKHLLPKKFSQPKTSGLSATVSEGGNTHFEFDL